MVGLGNALKGSTRLFCDVESIFVCCGSTSDALASFFSWPVQEQMLTDNRKSQWNYCDVQCYCGRRLVILVVAPILISIVQPSTHLARVG